MVSPPQSAMLYFILLRLDPEMQFGGHLIRGSGHSSLYPAISVQVLHVGRTCGSQHLRLACWDNPSELGWSKATIAHYTGELHGQRYKMDKVQARSSLSHALCHHHNSQKCGVQRGTSESLRFSSICVTAFLPNLCGGVVAVAFSKLLG